MLVLAGRFVYIPTTNLVYIGERCNICCIATFTGNFGFRADEKKIDFGEQTPFRANHGTNVWPLLADSCSILMRACIPLSRSA